MATLRRRLQLVGSSSNTGWARPFDWRHLPNRGSGPTCGLCGSPTLSSASCFHCINGATCSRNTKTTKAEQTWFLPREDSPRRFYGLGLVFPCTCLPFPSPSGQINDHNAAMTCVFPSFEKNYLSPISTRVQQICTSLSGPSMRSQYGSMSKKWLSSLAISFTITYCTPYVPKGRDQSGSYQVYLVYSRRSDLSIILLFVLSHFFSSAIDSHDAILYFSLPNLLQAWNASSLRNLLFVWFYPCIGVRLQLFGDCWQTDWVLLRWSDATSLYFLSWMSIDTDFQPARS